MAVYLNQYHFLPFKRVSEYFNTLYKMSVSAGTVANLWPEPMKIWLLLKRLFVTPCGESSVAEPMKRVCGPRALCTGYTLCG
ncbi:hypothetical protein [Endozoicomonas sp. SCSIO W0465]|uniref:hypothetical protein n=1 Tax=Endozoicomonas sp. SCSIO W0465 TaxID=2918516 RepID=UPI002076111F|nr:hypothetical protein [Endozoicomonas sp. SCSIO W0465]USE38192.1 hypothetical protein MJO57_08505 [Endozoicomonas sp. SCSIO W0465]